MIAAPSRLATLHFCFCVVFALAWLILFIVKWLPSSTDTSSADRIWCFFAGAMVTGYVYNACYAWCRVQARVRPA